MNGNGGNVIVFTHGRLTLERLYLINMGDIADLFQGSINQSVLTEIPAIILVIIVLFNFFDGRLVWFLDEVSYQLTFWVHLMSHLSLRYSTMFYRSTITRMRVSKLVSRPLFSLQDVGVGDLLFFRRNNFILDDDLFVILVLIWRQKHVGQRSVLISAPRRATSFRRVTKRSLL